MVQAPSNFAYNTPLSCHAGILKKSEKSAQIQIPVWVAYHRIRHASMLYLRQLALPPRKKTPLDRLHSSIPLQLHRFRLYR